MGSNILNKSAKKIQRVVYLGTPELAVPPLISLVNAGYEIPLVISGRDKRRGRGKIQTSSPVKNEAQRLGIPVSSNIDDIQSIQADIGVVVAFGELIPKDILGYLKMVNMHFSLLPRWRGAAPLERAILAGDKTTGICIMDIEETLDTGGVYHSVKVPITPEDTLDELQNLCVFKGTELLLDCLKRGFVSAVPQAGETSYAHKITSIDLKIVWTDSAEQILRKVRLGRAWTTIGGKRLNVRQANIFKDMNLSAGERSGILVGAGDGTVELVTVQPEGKKELPAKDWVNGLQSKMYEFMEHG
jgi:methionyl-tRNA formyltransferase